MAYSEAEQLEFALDDLLAASLPHEGADPVVVEVDDAELKLLRANHSARWRVLTGPQTMMIVAVLELGKYFHIAWAVSDEEDAAVQKLLRAGASLQLQITSRTQGTLEITAPPFPAYLRPQLTTPYLPVNAA
jgi:hypothetical protein